MADKQGGLTADRSQHQGQQMQNLYANFDGLDMAFFGTLDGETLEALALAQSAAREARADAPAVIGGLPIMVSEAGMRGGFRYRFTTGADGETWAIMGDNEPRGRWMIKVSANSAAFVQCGDAHAVRDRIAKRLAMIGYVAKMDEKHGLSHSITRVDFCVDFLADKDWKIDPEAIAFKGGKTVHFNEMQTFHRGRRVTGVTVGKMPNRQVVIYDKTADIAVKKKDYWWQVWGLDAGQVKADEKRVWRVELRAGKKFLRDTWDVRTFEDLERCAGDMFADTLNKVRYVTLSDSNITRCPDAPLWVRLRNVIAKGLKGLFSGLCPGAVRQTTRERFSATMQVLLKGVALTFASVTVGRDNLAEIKTEILRAADGVISEIINDPDDALKHAQKARGRYLLLGLEEWRKQRLQPVPQWLNGSARSGAGLAT